MNLENLETRQSTSSKKLYTGMTSVKIVTVNPTREWIAEAYKVDVEKVKEPVYEIDSPDREKTTRLDFWYTNTPESKVELLGKFSIFVSPEFRISKSGRKQYIDAYSKTTWADSIDDLVEKNAKLHEASRLDAKSARQAFKGEEEIYSLLKAYGNIDVSKKPFMLEDFKAIIKGNVRELKEFFDFFNKKSGAVKVLMGVRDGQYQDVWTNLFMSADAKVTDYIRNKITGEYGYKNYYAGSLNFQEFIAGEEPSISSSSSSDSSIDWSTETVTSSSSSDNDLF